MRTGNSPIRVLSPLAWDSIIATAVPLGDSGEGVVRFSCTRDMRFLVKLDKAGLEKV